MMEATNSPHLLSDLDVDRKNQQQDEQVAKEALDIVGKMLQDADKILYDLEKDDLLGEAIVRRCQELADTIGNLADDLESKSDEDRKALAQACVQDAQEQQQNNNNNSKSASSTSTTAGTTEEEKKDQAEDTQQDYTELTESDVLDAISGAHGLLRDVESTLRTIERQEADEIADVALTVARIFLMSLRNVYRTITPQHIVAAVTHQNGGGNSNNNKDGTPQIEIIQDGSATPAPTHTDTTTPTTSSRGISFPINTSTTSRGLNFGNISANVGSIGAIGSIGGGGNIQSKIQDMKTMAQVADEMQDLRGNERVRALWPPVGPAVASACNWGKEEAAKKPLLAVALGLTLWPAAIMTAFGLTPVVLADAAIQGVYNSMSNGPIIATVERGAAHVYHSARLTMLCSGLVAKQSLRIAKRQVKRNGGPVGVAQKVAGMALDRVMHPVQTVQMTWNGVMVGAGAVKDAAVFVHERIEREMDKDKASKMQ